MIGEISDSRGDITYRLDGTLDSSAQTLLFINDILTDWRVWEPLVSELKARYPTYRLLRYGKLPEQFSNAQTFRSTLNYNRISVIIGRESESHNVITNVESAYGTHDHFI
jgi:hypothetical protein